MSVTRHGKKRMHARLRVPCKNIPEHAQKAFAEGLTHRDISGRLDKYITRLYLSHMPQATYRVYHQSVYVFSGEVLLTVFPLPGKLQKTAAIQAKKKQKTESVNEH